MTTTGERLVTLSELLTVETAMVHYLAIETGSGPGGTVFVDAFDAVLEPDVDAMLEPDLIAIVEDEVMAEVDD